MKFEFNENGFFLLFEVTQDGFLRLIHFSDCEYDGSMEEAKKSWAQAVEVHISGDNQNDHHGAKHTGCGSREKLKYLSHRIVDDTEGKKLEIELSDGRMRVILCYCAYNGVKGLRCNTVVENISEEDITIECISSFLLTGLANDEARVMIPSNSWTREADWKEYSLSQLGLERDTVVSTKRISISNTGAWSSKEFLPMGCLAYDNGAYLWQIENNGSWCWEVGDIEDMLYLKLSGPSENENHWCKILKKGEKFVSVPVAVCIGKNFDSALAEMTAYRRKIVRRNIADESLPVIFNDYMNCLWADPTEEKMKPIIDLAAESGAEYYCMDAGWYADGTWWETVGEWQPCEWRFPNGIKAVFDYIKSKGMTPGIWLEIEVMGIDCPILDRFDDSCFFMRHGKRVIDHGRYQLDFRNADVRRFADGIIKRLVEEYGVGYIKMDYNIEPGMGTEVNADSFGDGLLGHNRAYLNWITEIMDKYPDIIIECCASGGMRMDYAMLSVYPLISASDRTDSEGTAFISASVPTAVLPEQAAIWACPKAGKGTGEVAFNIVNSLLMRMHLSGEINRLSKKELEIIKDGVKCYKETREYIKTLTPFYPMSLPKYNDKIFCCGFRNDKNIFLKIWCLDGDENELTIPISELKNVQILFSAGKCDLTINKNLMTVRLNDNKAAALIKIDV